MDKPSSFADLQNRQSFTFPFAHPRFARDPNHHISKDGRDDCLLHDHRCPPRVRLQVRLPRVRLSTPPPASPPLPKLEAETKVIRLATWLLFVIDACAFRDRSKAFAFERACRGVKMEFVATPPLSWQAHAAHEVIARWVYLFLFRTSHPLFRKRRFHQKPPPFRLKLFHRTRTCNTRNNKWPQPNALNV